MYLSFHHINLFFHIKKQKFTVAAILWEGRGNSFFIENSSAAPLNNSTNGHTMWVNKSSFYQYPGF